MNNPGNFDSLRLAIRNNSTTLLLVLIAVLLTLQIKSCFSKTVSTTDYYKERIAEKETQIKQVVSERDAERAKFDSLIALDRRRDTLLIERYKTNTIKYEAIPVYINSLDRDSLRAAVINQ